MRTFYHRIRNDGRQQQQRLADERRVLHVTGLRDGVGMAITKRNLVYAFNYAAQPDGDADADEDQQQVLDIYYPDGTNFAHIQMRSEEAARRAKSRLDKSWLFDRYISVDFGHKRLYASFLSNRVEPSPRVIFGVRNSVSHHQLAMPQADGNDLNEPNEEEQMRQNAFISKMPLGVTRHLMPGTMEPSGINKTIINGLQNDSDEREVQRNRGPESPVLYVSGIENSLNGKMLTRYDLIMLFSCYGEVVDCDVYMDRRYSSGSISSTGKHYALVQMSSVEQATHAMNSLDFSWQMGRFIKVTYSRMKSFFISNEQIKSKLRVSAAAQKGNNNAGNEMKDGSNNELSSANNGEGEKEALQAAAEQQNV